MTFISRFRCFFLIIHRNSGLSPVACQQSSCTFQALPRLEEYNISVVVKNQLGEETASCCFNIRDRGQRSFKRWTAVVLRNMFLCVLEGCALQHARANAPLSGLLSVVPVARWRRVVLGVTTANLSLIIQGNLTMDTLLCQVTTDPGSSSEVSSATSGPAEVLKVEPVLDPRSLCLQQLSCDRFRGSCKVKLKHLSPSSQYAVRGRCCVTGRLWGPWTKSESFKTRESPCAILVELC